MKQLDPSTTKDIQDCTAVLNAHILITDTFVAAYVAAGKIYAVLEMAVFMASTLYFKGIASQKKANFTECL